MDAAAALLWENVYPALSEGKPGLGGSLVARMEAQALRLASLYALLDLANVIRPEHLYAALALVDYCERSVRYVFGNSLGDPLADDILRALQGAPQGLTRTAISGLTGRNEDRHRLARALGLLLEARLARYVTEKTETKGRPGERWFAV
jgi:hypothetical protein